MVNDAELTKILNNFTSEIKALSKNGWLYALDIIPQPYIVISGLKREIKGLPIVCNSAAIKKRDEIAAYSIPFLTDVLHNERIDVNILSFANDGYKLNKLTEYINDGYLVTVIFDNKIDKINIDDLIEKYKISLLGLLCEGEYSPWKGTSPKQVPGFGSYF